MNVVIAAGGTGGHVYPAVALAEAFCRRASETAVTVVGTGGALEQTMLAGTPWTRVTVRARGVMGRGLRASMAALLLLPAAVWRSLRLLRAARADLVMGTGGYTSVPVVVAASLLRIPRAIVEMNAIPGVANRALGPLTHRVFLSCEQAAGAFRADKVVVVGTPVREAFVAPPVIGSGKIATIFVCGGSQGARAVNAAVMDAVEASSLMREQVTLIHQTGRDDYERVADTYRRLAVRGEVAPFVTAMAETMRRADLVISRCGALALAEIAACAKPAILIPFPHAAHQHQAGNARVVEQAGAAVVIPEIALTGTSLAATIEALMRDPARVRRMAEQSLRLRRTDAASAMVEECYRWLAPAGDT